MAGDARASRADQARQADVLVGGRRVLPRPALLLGGPHEFVDSVEESGAELPPSPLEADGSEQSESVYNEVAAATSAQHLPAGQEDGEHLRRHSDRDLRRVDIEPPVRACQAASGLKRSQSPILAGVRLGRLLLDESRVRDAARARIAEAEAARATAENDPSFLGRFVDSLNFNTPEPRSIEIVYAVIARWNDRTPAEALPFFSKVNLRRTIGELRRVGYNVSFHRIEVT